jgi:hypothetical protein
MRDLDFRGVLEDVTDATQQPEFGIVRRRTARMRTRRRVLASGGALAVAAVLAAGGVAVTGGGGDGLPELVGSPATETGPQRIQWAGAADADHLYALVGCPTCDATLMASSDGGQTWQPRPTDQWLAKPAAMLDLYVLGPEILAYGLPEALTGGQSDAVTDGLRGKGNDGPTQSRETPRISLDAGRTWKTLSASEEPVAAAPDGTRLLGCGLGSCDLHAVDPATGVLAPLATQPPLTHADIAGVPLDAGLWVSGLDPASGKPAVAVSRDGGKSWRSHVFTDEAVVPQDRGLVAGKYITAVATYDGRTVYATLTGTHDGIPHLYRSADGGRTWRRTNPDGPPSGVETVTGLGYATADGAHVTMFTEGNTFVLRVSTNGRDYRPLVAAGGPPTISVPPDGLAGGQYLMRSERALYLSGDGRTWRQVTLP